MAKLRHLIAASLAFLPAVIQAKDMLTKVVVYHGTAASSNATQYALNLVDQFEDFVSLPADPSALDDLDSPWALNSSDLYIQPGGTGDIFVDAEEMVKYKSLIRNYVSNGGRYLGIGAGAYMASPLWLGLLPNSTILGPWERYSTLNDDDSHTSVNWTWSTGPKAGHTIEETALADQDDNVIIDDFEPSDDNYILGRYAGGQIAASISRYDKGWVGLLGFHPPDSYTWTQGGINNDIASDLFKALMAREPGK